jgi:uncharacterized repeat protein (TIGR02543 family)
MGTSKKLILASLVCMLMVMAFSIGLIPSHDADPTGAATGDERVNMVDLIDMMLGVKQVEEVTLRPGIQARTIKVGPDTASIPMPFEATVDGDGNELVTFVANSYGEFTIGDGQWLGNVFTEPIAAPYAGTLDLGSFLADQIQNSVYVYALVNAVEATKQTTLMYEASSMPVQLNLMEVDIDLNANGFPDDIREIGPGEVWFAQVEVDGVMRHVGILNLDDAAVMTKDMHAGVESLTVGNVTVTAPNRQALQDAQLSDTIFMQNIDEAWLILEVSPELSGLVDDIDGDTSAGAIMNWADAVADLQPGGIAGMANFAEISMVYRLEQQTQLRQLKDMSTSFYGDPTTLSVTLEFHDLEIENPDAVQVWAYPTDIRAGADGITASSEVVDWVPRDTTPSVNANSVIAVFNELSIFAPLESVMLLNSVSPSVVPVGVERELTLAGLFQTKTAMNLAQAQEAYAVFVDGNAVAFREVDGEAITAYEGSENFIFVTLPAQTEPGMLDVQVVDLNVPDRQSTLLNAIEVVQTVTLSTEVVGNAGAASIEVSESSEEGLPADTYVIGESVTATLTFDEMTDDFVGWVFNGDAVGSNNPITVSLTEESNTLQAILEQRAEFEVTTELVGNIDEASIVLDPASETGIYLDGTTVTASVIFNDAVDTFLGWELNGEAAGTELNVVFTVDQDIHVVANFAPPEDQFRLTVNVETGGTVEIDPESENGFYEAGAEVTLTAVPNTENGYFFTGWTGPSAEELEDASSEVITIVMDSDKEFTATFEQINLAIVAVEPNEAWLFGGVVAKIHGAGLTEMTNIFVDGIQVQGFRAETDGSAVEFIVPASTDDTGVAFVFADVTVTRGEDSETLENAITYYRHRTVAGLNSTAFMFDAADSYEVGVTLGQPHSDFGTLRIPVLDDENGTVYGIARTSTVAVEAKETTQPIGLGSNLIDAGEPVADVREFSVYFYEALEAAKNTPPAGSAIFALAQNLYEASPGSPDVDTMTFSFPVLESALTAGDVRSGLSLYGVETAFDYATGETTAEDPALVLYQSELLNDEVIPALLAEVEDEDAIELINMARLYSLNSFSLRSEAPMSAEVAEALLDANAPTGLNGTVRGGVELEIESPLGNLAWVDRIEFRTQNGQLAATQTDFITPRGSDEYSLVFDTPESSRRGMMDVSIFLRSTPEIPAVTLEQHFEYRGVGIDRGLLTVLLALLIALLGLASGGTGGGSSSSGPCFIATAAYGTPMAAEIDTLRAVRDTYLLESAVGSAFVDAYYRVSPAVADVVAGSPFLAALVRVLLIPVVFLGKVALAMPTLTAFVGLSLGAAYMLRRRVAHEG